MPDPSRPNRRIYVALLPLPEVNLVIEIDGDSHAPPDQADYDAARTRGLEERGYRVIRFTAVQVEEDLAGVVQGKMRECEVGAGDEA